MELRYSLDKIDEAAATFWEQARHYKVWSLEGGLGAGKTTFTAALCRLLQADRPVSSPTFSLVNEYRFKDETGGEKVIFHSDWYRLHDEEEAIDAGMEDMLQQPGAYCIVEWAERAPALLPPDTFYARFELAGDNERLLHLTTS